MLVLKHSDGYYKYKTGKDSEIMKNFSAAILLISAIATPMTTHANSVRPDGDLPQYENLPSSPNICLDSAGQPYYCPANAPTKSKKHKNTGEIVMISVAVGAVFVGAMYYFFKKKPSENNPGQVKLMEF